MGLSSFCVRVGCIVFFTAIATATLYGYSDLDLDGVDDAIDKCPQTPLFDLVDATGCTKETLSPKIPQKIAHYDLLVGVSYAQSDYHSLNQTDTTSVTLSFDYYYKQLSFLVSTSYFYTQSSSYSSSGLYDTFTGVYYNFYPQENFNISLGGGVILPTYNSVYGNNSADYSVSLNFSYMYSALNLFGGYIYTLINDSDVVDTDTTTTDLYYQNTNSINIGLGYYVNDALYSSISYNQTDSIYADIETIRSVMLYGTYSIDSNYFTTFSFDYGLSDSASDYVLSLRIGYYY
jgi:hypothetical protein